MLTHGCAQVFEAAMNAGADDIQRAEGEDRALEGYKARHTSCLTLPCALQLLSRLHP